MIPGRAPDSDRGRPPAAPAPAPTVVIIGGFLSSPPMYWRMRDRLVARGARAVHIAPIWLPDWVLVAVRGQGPVATRSARTVLAASEAAAGVPLLVVGHSAGGIVARILTAEAPFDGRRFSGAGRIGAVVTLGCPHVNAMEAATSRRSGVYPTAFVDEHVPGAFWAPRIGYLSVGSRWMVGLAGEHGVRRFYERLLTPPYPDVIEGDGLIPVASAMLPGAREVVLDDAAHGQGSRHAWYGSDKIIDEWWPSAIDVWRSALAARAGSAAAPA